MSNGLAKINLIGNVGKDPEHINFGNGGEMVKFSLAVNNSWKDRNGEKHETTNWFDVALHGNQQKLAQYIKKGMSLYIEARVDISDKDGKRYWNCTAQNIVFLSSAKQDGAASGAGTRNSAQPPLDGNIPF